MKSVKGSSNWVGVNFVEGNYPTVGSNIAFAFIFESIDNLTLFSCKLLYGKQQIIKFDDTKTKVPQLHFRIDIV